MENVVKESGSEKPKFTEKYGVWLMLIGLVALVFLFKFILVFIDKL